MEGCGFGEVSVNGRQEARGPSQVGMNDEHNTTTVYAINMCGTLHEFLGMSWQPYLTRVYFHEVPGYGLLQAQIRALDCRAHF